MQRASFTRACSELFFNIIFSRTTSGGASRIQLIATSRFNNVDSVLHSLRGRFGNSMDFSAGATRQVEGGIESEFYYSASFMSYLESGGNEVFYRVAFSRIPSSLGVNRLHSTINRAYSERFRLPIVGNSEDMELYRGATCSMRDTYSRVPTSGRGLYNSAFRDFCSNEKGCIIVLSSNVNANPHTTLSSTVTSNLVTELIGTNFKFRDTLELIGSSLLLGSHSRSLTALSVMGVSLCANGTIFCGTKTTPSIVHHRGNGLLRVGGTTLPTKVLHSTAFSSYRKRLRGNSAIVVTSSNTCRCTRGTMGRRLRDNNTGETDAGTGGVDLHTGGTGNGTHYSSVAIVTLGVDKQTEERRGVWVSG